MRTIVLNEPFRLAVREGPVPEPAPGEALVRVLRAGVCGTDLHAFRGEQPFFTYPRVLGHELAVEIAGFGGGSAGGNLAAGDRCVVNPYLACGRCAACRAGKPNCCARLEVLGVHRDGGMAEFITVPVEQLVLARGLDPDEMALVENQCIGCHAVGRARIRAGETVLVVGAGPIGLGVIRFALLEGARVLVMDRSEERLAFCRSHLAADHFIPPGSDPAEVLRAVSGGALPAVVFDATGSRESMEAAFRYVEHGGRLVFVGLVQGQVSFDDPEFHKRELTVLASRNARPGDFERVIRSMEKKEADVRPFVTHRASFEAVPRAFPEWVAAGEGVVKAVVDFEDPRPEGRRDA